MFGGMLFIGGIVLHVYQLLLLLGIVSDDR